MLRGKVGYCIVLYCIMRPCTEGRLNCYHIGIPRENPKFALNLGTCEPRTNNLSITGERITVTM